MEQFLIELASKYQVVMTICLILGAFRLVFKPLMALIKAVIEFTPSKNDDAFWSKLEGSKVYKAIVWFIDYLLSIKLPGAK